MANLYILAKSGDYNKLRRALRVESNLNVPDVNGKTPLYYATAVASVSCVSLLLRKGANPFVGFQNDGCRRIPNALGEIQDVRVRRRVMSTLHPFLVTPSNLNVIYRNKTHLMEAAKNKDISMVRMLIRRGADIHQEVPCGTALHHACMENGNAAVIRLLVQHGSKLHLRAGRHGTTPLGTAVGANRPSTVEFLVNNMGANLYERYGGGKWLTHLAAKWDSPDSLETLLALGLSAELRDNRGNHILHTACKHGRLNCLVRLLEIRKDQQRLPMPVNHQGFTPLHLAVLRKNLQCIRLLVEGGANVNHHAEATGLTALHLACKSDCVEVVELLETLGADHYAQDVQGNRPCHLAGPRVLRAPFSPGYYPPTPP